MEKGFSIVYKGDTIVKSVNETSVGDTVTIKLIDGSLKAKITEE